MTMSTATTAESPVSTAHLSPPLPAGQARLRGPSPIREKLDHISDRVRNGIRRARSRSSVSSTGSNTEHALENWITNVGTTSLGAAAVGGGEAFKTSYEQSVNIDVPRDFAQSSPTSIVPKAPAQTASALPHALRGRILSADMGQASDRASIKSSSTVVSYQTFHTAREFDHSSDLDGASVTSDSAGATAGPPAARMFLRQFSNFLAHGSPESNELFFCERHQVVDDDDDDMRPEPSSSSSTTVNSTTVSEPTAAPSPLKNVMTIAVYHHDSAAPVVKMQALIDTGNFVENMMAAQFAARTGHAIEPLPPDYIPPVLANGMPYAVLGTICVRWYFHDAALSTRSYDVRFLVVADPVRFDVALGWDFVKEQGIYIMSPWFGMTIYPSGSFFSGASTEAQRREQARLDQERRERDKQLRRQAERAARERAASKPKK